eukprot:CAMPEP_0195113878 /NCGR_PEP_ID=MMETSP0448-20130528/104164_1 /TAXON_ID=66468 /ORGANISM="Heterocapsa triquestra, Strain CCMP 448" /LENGTH=49 /DNA_ID= /DNA_START= /DNA_END= /DNA_ORIENTATION=
MQPSNLSSQGTLKQQSIDSYEFQDAGGARTEGPLVEFTQILRNPLPSLQ